MSLEIRAPKTPFLWIGGILASALPFCLGLFFLYAYWQGIRSDCKYSLEKNNSMGCEFYLSFGSGIYEFIFLPMTVCFILIVPLISYLCIRKIIVTSDLQWEDIITYGFTYASRANFWVALSFNVGLLIIFLFALGFSSDALSPLLLILVFAIILQFITWVGLTMPLMIIGTTVFRLVALKKTQ